MSLVWKLVLPAAVLFAFVVSLIGVAVGAGLLVRREATLRALRSMNRWISTRQVLKALEVPREVGKVAPTESRWLGPALLLCGGIALVVLVASYGDFKPMARLGTLRGSSGAVAVAIATESLYLVLMLGSAIAAAAGFLMAFYPSAWKAIEARANRWYSLRRMISGGDEMHLTLDRLAETHPRAAGLAILVASLLAAVVFGVLVFAQP